MKSNSDVYYKWIALFVVVIGTFMAILDSSIVNIAIPKMMAVFGVSVDDARWIITSYSLVMGAVVPVSGYLSDRFGTKRVYIFSLIAFTVGSFLCGFAWSNTSMIVSRIIQALGGGLIMPVSMSIIYQIIPPEERGMALGFWGIAAMAAPAIGPTLSGYIIQQLDWRLIFMVNIPVGIVGVIITWILLKPMPTKPPKKFDYIGFITAAVGLVSLLYVLGEGSNVDWNDIKNVLYIIIGVGSLVIFVINELYHSEPLLDLRILKILPYSLSIVISSILSMAMFGVIFIMPLFLQSLRGLSAMDTGMLMLPSAVATGIIMPIGGKLFDKFGAKPVIIPGLVLMILTTYELSSMTMDTSLVFIKYMMVMRGIGIGLCMMPSTSVGMNAVPAAMVARASALSNTMRQVAGAVSITVLTTILQGRLNLSLARLAEQVNPFNPTSMSLVSMIQAYLIQGGIEVSQSMTGAYSVISGLLTQNAYLDGINSTMIVATAFGALTLPLAMFIKGGPVKKKTQANKENDTEESVIIFE